MNEAPTRNESDHHSPMQARAHPFAGGPLTLVGPRVQVLIGACVLVLTAYTLGVSWLGTTWAGLPMGLWVVGLAMLVAQYRHQSRLDEASEKRGAMATRLDLAQLRLPVVSLDRLRSAIPSTASLSQIGGGVLEMVGVNGNSIDTARKRLSDLSNKMVPSSTTVRIGVDLAEADAKELIAYGLREDHPQVQVEWTKARAGLITDVESDMAAAGLDVLVRRERRGDINVFVAESADRPAAWPDWSVSMPLGYAGVFPPRIDPARLVLAGCDLQKAEHATLASQMVVACALLARVPGRAAPSGGGAAGLGRILGGRGALPVITEANGPLALAMDRIARSLERSWSGPLMRAGVPGFVRAAARACGAHAASMDSAAPTETLLGRVKAACALTGDEVEGLLRLAAAQYAACGSESGRSQEARATLVRACEVLSRSRARCDADPLPFIMSEVEVGSAGPMALGRIAAGIGLLWATAPRETVDYLREDLLDDLRHAGWLRERPEDVEMLKGVIEALECTATVQRAAA